jgi:hypothetical protein
MQSATFNRTFVDSLPEEAIMTLMLGPSLIKKPFKLRDMILAKEDEGFAKSRNLCFDFFKYFRRINGPRKRGYIFQVSLGVL